MTRRRQKSDWKTQTKTEKERGKQAESAIIKTLLSAYYCYYYDLVRVNEWLHLHSSTLCEYKYSDFIQHILRVVFVVVAGHVCGFKLRDAVWWSISKHGLWAKTVCIKNELMCACVRVRSSKCARGRTKYTKEIMKTNKN